MGDEYLSPHFKRSEFACRCGCGFGLGDGDVDPRLVAALEEFRRRLGDVPVIVNSGCRCAAHNARTPGAVAGSLHVKGKAADVRVKAWRPSGLALVAEEVEAFRNGGIGVYHRLGFVHLDVRGSRKRW